MPAVEGGRSDRACRGYERVSALGVRVRRDWVANSETLALRTHLVAVDGMGLARFSFILVATAGIVSATTACDGSSEGAADTDASAAPETSSAPTTNASSEGDTSPTTAGRDCPLPTEWQRAPFVDVTGGPDQPDPDLLRTMAAAGGATESSDDYRVTVARLISDDATSSLPPIDEEGMRSEEWWDGVDHDVYLRVEERGLGEVGVDFCVWFLKSQRDYETTQTEVIGRLEQG